MNRWVFLFIFCVTLSIFTISSDDTVYAQTAQSSYILSDLQYEAYPEFSRILFASNERIDFITYELENPYRIVIDLIGVSFCELQERADYVEGLVKSVEIVKMPYVKHPEGLDEYFYSVDYIMITPVSDLPYRISASSDGKVIAVDIGKGRVPKVEVKVEVEEKLAEEKPEIIEVRELPEEEVMIEVVGPDKESETLVAKPTQKEEIPQLILKSEDIQEKPKPRTPKKPSLIDENIVDYVHYETLDDEGLLVISTNKDVGFEASVKQYPKPSIVLTPTIPTFADLQERGVLDGVYLDSVEITKNKAVRVPATLDEYFYPVKNITVELTRELQFDFYSNKEGTIYILEVYYPGMEEPTEAVEIEAEPKRPEPTFEATERYKILKELKEEIKREGLLKREKVEEAKEEEIERRSLEASHMAAHIGKEVLKDLIVRGKGILSLGHAQKIGIENSPQAKTSKEELKLANMKKKEALRALFPNVKLKASHTVGDVFEDISFTEEIYGVQGEHPLYQGGRLWNTYQQSKVNQELADSRYRKIENDLDYKIAEAYYNAVTAIMNIRLQKDLLKEVEPVVKAADKRYAAGLSTDLEILNVKSRYNQIQFQLATAERDLALARFKLKQAMNLDITEQDIDIQEVDTDLPFKAIDVNLNECLQLASNNQPDIEVNKLLVESNEFGEKIAKGKSGFKVDLTGFYGKADSYYDTEPKDLQSDWSVGVKVSKPFWGHTPSYSFSKDKTSRKVGQDERTGSTVNAGELALFDKEAMAVDSEIKEANISKQKAENDLIETRRQTALEVKEAYYNYQESILQVKNALEKVKFQEEAAKVAKAQAGLNEALQSQLLDALIKLTDEKSLYIKALSDYNLALIKLNKSIGIKDYFRVD